MVEIKVSPKLKDGDAFVMDASGMQKMLEDKKAFKFVLEVKKMKDNGLKILVYTTSASLLRAIFLCTEQTDFSKLQKLLSIITEVFHSEKVDFRNENAVRNEIIQLVTFVQSGQNRGISR